MNDAACDPWGRCFAGTMAFDVSPGASSLYRLEPDLSIHTVTSGLSCSNGIDWSLSGTSMYHVDSLAGGIDVLDFDGGTGAASGRRRLVDTPEAWGLADGLTVDSEGGVWVAFWDGSAVRRFDPSGALTAVIEVPCARPTKPWFGGEDLDLLYITSARRETDRHATDDLGGAIFVADPGIRGRRANAFAPAQPLPSHAS
jgi:sugar lactone lactonase YvrE